MLRGELSGAAVSLPEEWPGWRLLHPLPEGEVSGAHRGDGFPGTGRWQRGLGISCVTGSSGHSVVEHSCHVLGRRRGGVGDVDVLHTGLSARGEGGGSCSIDSMVHGDPGTGFAVPNQCLSVVLPFLQALTQVAAEDEAEASPAAPAGGSLLELEQHHARQRRKLLVLQLVATLCESVSDTVFTDIAQVGHGTAHGEQQLGCMVGLCATAP